MSFKIPNKINIKGKIYTVIRVAFRKPDHYGDINFDKKIIRIHKTKKTRASFVHECLHAVLFESGIKHLDEDFEEGMIESLSDFIHEKLMD